VDNFWGNLRQIGSEAINSCAALGWLGVKHAFMYESDEPVDSGPVGNVAFSGQLARFYYAVATLRHLDHNRFSELLELRRVGAIATIG